VNPSVLRDSLLGGSAPRLEHIQLHGIPFPALPQLLLSTHNLVQLDLFDIPQSGYVSPEVMVYCLSTLTRLHTLWLQFRSPGLRVNQHPPPLTRAVLPALTCFDFRGNIEDLDVIVSRLDAPLLSHAGIHSFDQQEFNTPFLRDFISRTKSFRTISRVRVYFGHRSWVHFPFEDTDYEDNGLEIISNSYEPDEQLSSLAQVCRSSLPLLPTLEHLEIFNAISDWYEDREHSHWIELLQPFTSVKDLVISKDLVRLVAPALQGLGQKSVTGVLPKLQNLFLNDPQPSMAVQEAVRQFIAARQLSGHPVTAHRRDGRRWNSEYVRWEVNDR
jgi:hypothetical protein